jgi:protein-L-isoaspartate(D-aspartate) O-methyltransferase
MDGTELQALRDAMVRYQIAERGVHSPQVLRAMRQVPREAFVDVAQRHLAYEDNPLPIGEQQTLSQPYVVALMAEALQLRDSDRVLEVGTGSGYAAAVLGRIARQVFGVERVPSLADSAATRLRDLGYDNVQVRQGDGTLGWAEHAPFDAIMVSAGGPHVPPSLKSQLALGGRLVMPVGRDAESQELLVITRTGQSRFKTRSLGGVRFVPLIGEQGWKP